MATQSVEFTAPPNQALTVRLFSAGSDTIVATAGTVTAATNRAGLYTAAFTNVPAGRYRLIATNAAGTPLATWWTDLTLTTATFPAYEMPLSAITADVYAALPADHTVAGSYGARFILALNNNRVVQITGSHHAAAVVHDFEPNVITADAIAADAVTEIQAGLATLANQTTIIGYLDTEIASIKSVTDKLNTGLVADGQLFQFTANMLELAPGGGGGGSATLENQELILDEIDSLRSSFASAVGRLAVSAQLIGFPPSIVRNSDYSTVTESEIRLSLKDIDGAAITEIGGVPCDEITWLFGLGSERSPALIEGAATWDDTNDQLVIQLAADDTTDKPTGTLTWQIGCTIDDTTRYLGGGTTRLLERHF